MARQKALENVGNSEIAYLIDEWIKSERDRAILKSRLIDGLTYGELADKYALSERRLKTIIYKAEDYLFRHI